MSSDRFNDIKNNIEEIKREIGDVSLIAVSKYFPIEDIIHAYNASQLDFGENKVQQLSERANSLHSAGIYSNIRWHLLGHLQTNKVTQLFKIPNLYCIHSVDSEKLFLEMVKKEHLLKSENGNKIIKFFLQIKTTDEDEKSGLEAFDEIVSLVEMILKYTTSSSISVPLEWAGFMTMGPIRTTNFEEDAQKSFLRLVEIKEKILKLFSYQFQNNQISQINKLSLSMGMSSDYKIAIKAGSNCVRIGSSLFRSTSL